MSLELLDKTRKINGLLNESNYEKVDFKEFCRVLSQVLNVNVMLISSKGKILGKREKYDVEIIPEFAEVDYGEYVELSLKERMMSILSTKENVNLSTLGLSKGNLSKYQSMISPVSVLGNHLGVLFVYRENIPFSIDDIILIEYGATVVALAMQRAESEEASEEEHKMKEVISVLNTMSKREKKGIIAVLEELDGCSDGVIISSKLADKVGITRSIIVNAMKKCESAGVIRTKSSGMKGTNVKVINDLFSVQTITDEML